MSNSIPAGLPSARPFIMSTSPVDLAHWILLDIIEPMAAVSETVQKCSEALGRHYGAAFQGLVVYGSTARKEDTPASDIDLLVLLNKPFDYFQELKIIIDVLYLIQLESDRLISAKPALAEDFEQGTIALYRNARREGVIV